MGIDTSITTPFLKEIFKRMTGLGPIHKLPSIFKSTIELFDESAFQFNNLHICLTKINKTEIIQNNFLSMMYQQIYLELHLNKEFF